MAKCSQDRAGDLGSMQGSCVNIERNGKHATPNVTSHCLWIDEVRRGDNDANANIGSQVHIGHHRDPLYIRGAPEAL
jgi:hypothetical protein